MLSGTLGEYTDLLKIRQKYRRREMIYIGVLFGAAFLGMIVFGLLTEPNSNSVYLSGAIVAMLGISYLMAWVRHEVVKENLELLDTLQRDAAEIHGASLHRK